MGRARWSAGCWSPSWARCGSTSTARSSVSAGRRNRVRARLRHRRARAPGRRHVVSFAAFEPKNLFVAGVGAAFALVVTAFTGFEAAPVFAEEAKHARKTIPAATYLALAVMGILYAVTSWAIDGHHRPEQCGRRRAARTRASCSSSTAARLFNSGTADLALLLLFTSLFAAAVSFHNSVARYSFALGREGVLPRVLGTTNARTGAPLLASIIQTVVGLIVIVVYAIAGWDPTPKLFFWLGTTGGFGILILLIGTSIAAIIYFAKDSRGESIWSRLIAPALATIALGYVFYQTVKAFSNLLGVASDDPIAWILPGLYALMFVIGDRSGRSTCGRPGRRCTTPSVSAPRRSPGSSRPRTRTWWRASVRPRSLSRSARSRRRRRHEFTRDPVRGAVRGIRVGPTDRGIVRTTAGQPSGWWRTRPSGSTRWPVSSRSSWSTRSPRRRLRGRRRGRADAVSRCGSRRTRSRTWTTTTSDWRPRSGRTLHDSWNWTRRCTGAPGRSGPRVPRVHGGAATERDHGVGAALLEQAPPQAGRVRHAGLPGSERPSQPPALPSARVRRPRLRPTGRTGSTSSVRCGGIPPVGTDPGHAGGVTAALECNSAHVARPRLASATGCRSQTAL